MKKQKEQGFTLIELSMSLVFIAFIILFLTMVMLNIIQIYNKGIWLSQINQVGRQINTDISDQARFSKNKVVILKNEQRFCIGGVSYIWNTSGSFKNRFSDESDASMNNKTTKLRFVRVTDNSGAYCSYTDPAKPPMPERNNSNTSAMLGPGVTVQQFNVTEGATGLLRVHAVFSTEGGDQPTKVGNRWECGQNQFCAFAEFNVVTYRRLGE